MSAARWPGVGAGLVLALVVAGYAVSIIAPVVRTTHLADDYRQAAIWMVDAHAGVPIEGDPIAEYSRGFMPPALAEVYGALVRAVDPYLLTKWLSLGLVAGFVLVAAGVGRSLAGRTGAMVLAALVVADLDWNRAIFGALSRSYSPVLQAGLVWAVLSRRPLAIATWLGVAGLLHPQSMLLGAAVVVLSQGLDVLRGQGGAFAGAGGAAPSNGIALEGPAPSGPQWRAKRIAWLLPFIACLAINAMHLRDVERSFGAMYGREELLALPEMSEGGRWANERPDALVIEVADTLAGHLGVVGSPFESQRFDPGGKRYGRAIALLAIVLPLLEVLRRAAKGSWREVPSVVPAMIVAGVGMALVAEVLLPRLYFPRRFVEIGVPFAMQMLIAMWLARWMERVAGSSRRVVLPIAVLALLAASGLARLPGGRFPGYWVRIEPYQKVAQFLAAQPPETVYAARPLEDADTLAALVPRPVFAAREIGHPLFRGYLETVIRPRTLASWRAIFPVDPGADLRALREGGAALLVLRRSDLVDSVPLAREIDEPYRSAIAPGWDRERAARRALFWREHGEAIVYRDHDYVVADLARLDARDGR